MPNRFGTTGATRDVLDLLDDNIGLRRGREKNEGLIRGLQMLSDSIGAAMERRRRKQEREQEIAIRKQERAEDDQKYWEGKMADRQTAEIERMAESAGKRQDKQEEERLQKAKVEQHRDTINKINDLLAQANMADDDISERQYVNQANMLADALPVEVHKAYPKLAGLEQKLTQLNTNIRTARDNAAKEARDAAKEEAKNKPKPLGPAQQRLWDELGKKADAAQDGDEQLGYLALQTAVEQGEALTSVIKEMRDIDAGSEQAGTGKDAFTGSEIQKLGENQQFSSASDVKTISPRVLVQLAIAKDLGIKIDEEAVFANPDALEPMTTGARISKKKFAAVVDAYAELDANGKTDDPVAVRQALDEAYKSYGIPVEREGVKYSAVDKIVGGNVKEDYEVAEEGAIDPEELRSDVEGKYPDIYDLLRDDEDGSLAEAINDEYGLDGLAEYLMLNQMSSVDTGRSLLAR